MNKLDEVRTKVLKKAPTAKLLFDSDKNLYIDVDGVNLAEEHLLPPTKDPVKAWELADISLKMTQNFERTNPSRLDMLDGFGRKDRINRRRKHNGEY